MWIPSFQSSFRRRLEGWQAVRGLLQSVALEDTEDVFPSTIFDLVRFNMCSTIEKEELRLAAIQALKEATDLKFCEHCLLLKHSDPFKMRSAMMPAAHVGQPTRCQGWSFAYALECCMSSSSLLVRDIPRSVFPFPFHSKALETFTVAAAHCFKPLVKVLDERPL